MALPPLLPDARRRRALEVARLNGRGVIAFCLVGAALALVRREWLEAGLGLVATSAGLLELSGRRRALAGAPDAWRRLVGAQVWLLALILGYAAWRWVATTPEELWRTLPGFLRQHLDTQLYLAGFDPALDRPFLLALLNQAVCGSLALVALAYQGGLALYYARRRGDFQTAG